MGHIVIFHFQIMHSKKSDETSTEGGKAAGSTGENTSANVNHDATRLVCNYAIYFLQNYNKELTNAATTQIQVSLSLKASFEIEIGPLDFNKSRH